MFLVALTNCSVQSDRRAMSDKTMRAAITAAGNETMGLDE
jgi:hypothetical protein